MDHGNRVERLVMLIRRLAQARQPLPTSEALATTLGLPGRETVYRLMASAADRGLIVVHRRADGRVCAVEAPDGRWRVTRAVPQRACLRCRRPFAPRHRLNFLCVECGAYAGREGE